MVGIVFLVVVWFLFFKFLVCFIGWGLEEVEVCEL